MPNLLLGRYFFFLNHTTSLTSHFTSTQVWDVATILGYNADYTEVRLKWNMSGFEYSTEFVKENVQSLNEGRVRKVKVNLFEDEQHLRSLIGIRPMKEKKEKVPLPDGEKAHRAIAQKDIHSTTLEEVRAAEHTADRSLSVHLPQFKMFISSKVYERMRHASLGKTSVADNTVNITDTISTSDSLNLDSSVVTSSSSSSSESAVQNNSNIVINKKLSQPSTIKNVEMRDYQLLGLSWMVSQYDKCINSILADEMGLGKTLQTISFISYLKDVRKVKGPHLVVVPLSVIFNWIAECRKFCPTLRVLRLHSNSADEMKTLKAKLIQDDSYDLCVTSYEMVKSGGMSNTLAHMVWRTVILDEGHRIKNLDTFISKACMRLR
jgi:SNF2 family DNA or RNA helicase